MKLDESTYHELKKSFARNEMRWFAKYVYKKFDCQWFHKQVCVALNKFYSGEIKKLAIFMPPQCGKSELASRLFPAYALGRNPDLKIALAAYQHDLAAGFNRSIQRYIQSDEYKELFNISIGGEGYQKNNNEFEITDHTGRFTAVGVGSALTGKPVDIGIIDDPIKDRKEAESKRYRDRVWEWYTDVFKTRLHNDSRQLICLTRWNEDDLIGRIFKKEREEWTVIIFPGLKEDDSNPDDPRKIGEALWKERHSRESYLADKRDSERKFASLIQQRPAPAEGTLFLEKWFRTYTSVPVFEKIFQSWDCSFKDEKDSDYVAGTIWGAVKSQLYLIGLYHGKWDFVKTVQMILRATKSYPNTTSILIEDKANGPAIISTLKQKVPGIIPINPDGGKYSRAYAATDYFEAGNILFPSKDISDWIDVVKNELKIFNNGKHDDIVDSISQAINYYYNKHNSWCDHIKI